jgi:GR25 family glycosyltransferase involved in LPS biosynthesis
MNTIVEHIYIINLKKDVHRLNNFKSTVGNLFDYEIVAGVDPINDENYSEKYKIWSSINEIEITFESFNWKYYVEKYSDLLNAKINTKKSAWEHWTMHGKKELRSCNPKNNIINKGQWGCLYSHINILNDAIKNNYKSILILEDDIILTSNIEDKITKLNSFMHIHENWNIIYLGASQHNWTNIQIEDCHYKANCTTGTFAYTVNNNFYKILLDEFIKMNKPVDNYLVDIQKVYCDTIYVIYPNIIICNLEESNIGEKRDNNEFGKKFRWIL